MNKQEAIRELNTKKDKNENVFEIEDYDTGFKCGARGAYENAINIVKQLDEPEKPVVPQFVADWYEENKDDFEFNIYYLCVVFHDRPIKLDNRIRRWFSNTSNKSIQTLVAMHFFGYEVGEEKLYKVSLKKSGIGMGVQQQDGSFKEQFTKTELSEYGFDSLDEYEIEEVKE